MGSWFHYTPRDRITVDSNSGWLPQFFFSFMGVFFLKQSLLAICDYQGLGFLGIVCSSSIPRAAYLVGFFGIVCSSLIPAAA